MTDDKWKATPLPDGTLRMTKPGYRSAITGQLARPAVARPDQGDGERCCVGGRIAIYCRDECPDFRPAPAVDPAHGAEPATSDAVLRDLSAHLVDGVERAALVEAVRVELVDAFISYRMDRPAAQILTAALLADDGPLAAVLAQAAADRAAVERAKALADDLADIAERHKHAAPGSYDAGMRRGYRVAAESIRDEVCALRPGGTA